MVLQTMASGDIGSTTTAFITSQSTLEAADYGYDSRNDDSRNPGRLSNGSSRHSTQSSMPPGKRLCQRRIPLKQFDLPVADEVQLRFRDLGRLFDKSLCEYLGEDGQQPKPIAITLPYLGEDRADAKPWIVVLCDKAISKKVRQWVHTEPVRSFCQPQDADTNANLPNFEVLVHERPPHLLSEDVYSIGMLGPDANHFTMCGRLLRTTDPNHGRLATFGGLLKLTWETRFAIYGITVQHVFGVSSGSGVETGMPQETVRTGSRIASEITSKPEVTFEAANDTYNERYEMFELEIPAEDSVAKERSNPLVTTKDPSKPSLVTRVGMQCPDRIEISNFDSGTGVIPSKCVDLAQNRLLDWALFNIEDSSKLWPNLLCDANGPHDIKMQESMNFKEGLEQSVYVISGMTGCIHGRISKVPSFITLFNPHRLIETYYLLLDDGAELQPGDSGSWVVDTNTHNVYGQVVASDMFKNIYVVPFANILQEIKDTYGAKSVTFPTHDELDFCAFSRPRGIRKGRNQQCHTIEDACSQFELTTLDSYLSGNAEIPGVIPNTSSGSFIPIVDAREVTKLQTVESKIFNDARYTPESEP